MMGDVHGEGEGKKKKKRRRRSDTLPRRLRSESRYWLVRLDGGARAAKEREETWRVSVRGASGEAGGALVCVCVVR